MLRSLVVFGECVAGRAIADRPARSMGGDASYDIGQATALVLGRDEDSVRAMAGLAGFEEAIGLLATDRSDPASLAGCIIDVVRERRVALVVLPAGAWWNDLACRIAAVQGVEPFLNCFALSAKDNGQVSLSRVVLKDSVAETRELLGSPCVATFPFANPRHEDGYQRPPARISTWIKVECQSPEPAMRVMAVQGSEPLSLRVEDADVVIAGGRGVGSAEGFRVLQALAGLLGGTIGGSRIAVDHHWISRDRQVGQTGSSISPRLYIACGISGASHHILGMKDSQTIIAINTDAQAPIFRMAAVGAVADCVECAAALVKVFKERKERDRNRSES